MKFHRDIRIHQLSIMLVLLAAVLLTHCANPISPIGGDKDEFPPKLDSLNSTPNYQTNFNLKEISFEFDEWVVVKSPFQQVVVSPPLTVPIQVKGRGKSVIVTFDDEEKLLDSTTYTINFGESIQDLNEGNPIPNFKYVFSTGPIIDSLLITGKIKDGESGEGEEDILVMLYDQLEDSVIYRQKPVYFTRTDEQGNFRIENIRQDSFILRALKDDNLNYLFDGESEKIGFLDSSIFITGFDTIMPYYNISLFNNRVPFRRSSKSEATKGVYKVAFNQSIDNRILSINTTLDDIHQLIEKDTLFIWHNTLPSDSAQVIIETAEKMDTLEIKSAFDPDKVKFQSFTMKTWSPSSQPLRIPTDPVQLFFSNPVETIDTSLFLFYESDSIRISTTETSVDQTDLRKVNLLTDWQSAKTYSWTALPGAFIDIFGQQNDTITFRLANPTMKDYGNIIVTAYDLDTSKQYVFELIDKGRPLLNKIISGDSIWTFTFTNLLPNTYSASFIEDLNRNGKWDTGDYLMRQKPERILKQELSPLRASWDVDADIRPNWNTGTLPGG